MVVGRLVLELVEGFEVVEVDGVLEVEELVTPVDGLLVVVVDEGTLLVVVLVLGTLLVVEFVLGTLLVVVLVFGILLVVVLVLGTLLVVVFVLGTLLEVVVLLVGTLFVVEGVVVGTLFVVVVPGTFPVEILSFEVTELLEATMLGYFSLKLTGVVLEVNPMPPPLRSSSLPEMSGRLPRLLCPLLVAVMLSRCPI